MGTGSILVRALTTLFWVEAEEVCVVATAPVKVRTTAKARMASFIMGPFLVVRVQVADSRNLIFEN
jgi:hypothetical protein